MSTLKQDNLQNEEKLNQNKIKKRIQKRYAQPKKGMKIQENAPAGKQKRQQLTDTTMNLAYEPTSTSSRTTHHFI